MLLAWILVLVIAICNPLSMTMLALVPGAFAVTAGPLIAPAPAPSGPAPGATCGRGSAASTASCRPPSSQDRFDFSGREELYTAYIPWAVAFGCADEWAAKYRTEMGPEPPRPTTSARYAGAGRLVVSSMVSDFDSTVSSAISSYQATQSSSSSGGGGASPAAAVAAEVAAAPGDLRPAPPDGPARPGPTGPRPREGTMMLIAIIVIVVLVLLVGFVITGFNKLRTTDVGAEEALGGIDVQLTRRAELIPNLVETVKGYATHESGVFEEITKARAGVAAAAAGDDVPAKAAADAALQQALVRVNAVAEAYPDLKANQNFLELQKQLAETENQLSFARKYYNDAVATLNKLVLTIPWMFFTGIANVYKREFYDAPEGHDVPTVKF